mmetsp:Transcript_14958/g.37659  ORF Transcript_14958/g.37659 Transcript_14958/m.37659 type:complete len:256 (+) Transcript_14958:142-909(+)|eukprot:CAMPEP_0116082100 /NCGR_PEP_ID=MMETSP0327-20121206/2554_1 /TAXON_ID=44447 /ORGANISM="Pseudo-nitzschia delicatissima, Strain B596" /LENGTH=255 /DNA_ID=CAMNT_0003572887 /DNA_START=60 /DNA_END=827 /DNA_ORIENTATION=+
MKYSNAINTIFFAAIAASPIHTVFAVPRPGPASKNLPPQQRRTTREDSHSTPSFGLLVDREGNLYSPHTTKETAQKNQGKNLALSLRGGEICVDNEGNFYTPTPQQVVSQVASQTKTLRDEAPSKKAPSSVALRGGSHSNNILGGLSVDLEGNLFATQGKASALSLRGGSLCVDNEGIFYTPRSLDQVKERRQGSLPSNRRLQSNGTEDAVLLTKSRVSKKISSAVSGSSAKAKKPLTADAPMAFIGYNNALMET